MLQHLLQRLALARADRGSRLVPQLGQRPGAAGVDRQAHRMLELQRVAAHPLAGDAARRDLLQHAVDERAQRARELRIGRILRQHEREVVPHRRQVAIGREQRRAQVEALDTRQAVALALAGEVKDQLLLVLGLHVHRALRLHAAR
jgi:hypothetical protein